MSFADESAKQERRERFRTALHFIALLAGRELPVTGNLVDQQTGRRAPGIEYQHTLTTVAVRRRQIEKAWQIDDRHQFAADIGQSVEPGLRIRDARGTWRRDHFTHILTRRDEPLRAERSEEHTAALQSRNTL